MSSLKVYACVDWNPATETCAAHAYIDPPTVLPQMSVQDGSEIGWAMLQAYLVVKLIAMLREAAADRIGQ